MRILIADDHPVVRKGIRAIVESYPGYEVSGEAEDGAEAVRLVPQINPDVLILDITMPLLNGLDAAKQILQTRPSLPILILSMHESGGQIEAAKKIGVKGYVPKSKAAEELIKAITMVASGKTHFPAR